MFVPIKELEPGMRVARDIASPSGAVLLCKGTELTVPLMSALSRLGLAGVQVADTGKNSAEVYVSPEIRQAAEGFVQRRFQHLPPDSPSLAALREIASRRSGA